MEERQYVSPLAGRLALSPVSVFSLQATALGIGLVFLASITQVSSFWVLSAFLAASSTAAVALPQKFPHAVLGLCNSVTLFRMALVAFLFGGLFVAETVSPWLVFGIGTIAFALDGLDGWLARRSGLESSFGARFDMETDAALGAVLVLWLILSGTTSVEVLILGFARYVFVAASWFEPRLRAELPESYRRKVICVVQIAALLFLVFPWTPAGLITPVSIGASVALCMSFGIDVRWLLRRES